MWSKIMKLVYAAPIILCVYLLIKLVIYYFTKNDMSLQVFLVMLGIDSACILFFWKVVPAMDKYEERD